VKKSYLALILLAAIVPVLFTGPVRVADSQEAKELCLLKYKVWKATILLRSDRRILIPGRYTLEGDSRYSFFLYQFNGENNTGWYEFATDEKGKRKIFDATFTWEVKDPDKLVITYTGMDSFGRKAKDYKKGRQETAQVLKHSEFLIINGKKYEMALVSEDASISEVSKGKIVNNPLNLKLCPNQPKGGQIFP